MNAQNHLYKILVALAVIVITACSGNRALAQVSASAQVGATIVTPMTIAKVSDMEFEQYTEKTASKSTRRSAQSRSTKAASATPVKTSRLKPASFKLSGYANYAYAVSVPERVTISNGSHEITLENIVASASSNQVLSASGTGTLSITGKPSIRPSSGMIAASEPTEGESEEPAGIPVTILYN